MELIQGDCFEKMKGLADNSVDAIITDPPYELGFMGKSWDNTGIANNKEMWGEALRVLKHGGYLMAFSGTRTYHRMACAIEDAGFEVRDMIEWVYGSGFPKSLNIGVAVDKLQGNDREVVGRKQFADGTYQRATARAGIYSEEKGQAINTKGTSEWEGWGTALKPAHEPICMARKPLAEKIVAENCLKWGTGGINIDESRVGTEGGGTHCNNRDSVGNCLGHNNAGRSTSSETIHAKQTGEVTGRFPANLIHDNSEEVRECFPNDSARFFKSIIYTAKASKSERNKGCEGLEEKDTKRYGDFEGTPEHAPKPNLKNTNNHPTVKPVALMEYLIKMVTREGQTVLDPFMGSGTTGVACRNLNRNFIGIEKEADYLTIADSRINKEQQEVLWN